MLRPRAADLPRCTPLSCSAGSMRSGSGGSLPPDQPVYREIEDHHEGTKHELHFAVQAVGIQHRKNVVLDKTALVAGQPPFAPEPMLQWRERADPAGKLDQRTPHRRRQVQPHDSAPAQRQQPAADHEQHEAEAVSYTHLTLPTSDLV